MFFISFLPLSFFPSYRGPFPSLPSCLSCLLFSSFAPGTYITPALFGSARGGYAVGASEAIWSRSGAGTAHRFSFSLAERRVASRFTLARVVLFLVYSTVPLSSFMPPYRVSTYSILILHIWLPFPLFPPCLSPVLSCPPCLVCLGETPSFFNRCLRPPF
ncbi:hypothetical protein C8R45DRAFT_195076 [Mycena sanguinolenta]|nr:hypothetical protein C8R45DRAFT_195076 [Mycena sanguinolenta]